MIKKKNKLLLILFISISLTAFESCNENNNQRNPDDNNKKDTVKSESNSMIYRTENIPDFSAYEDIKDRKKAFFSYLKPFVEQENKKVLYERNYILSKYQKVNSNDSLNDKEKSRLLGIALKYRVKSKLKFDEDFFRQLILKVDEIPVELALIQAANESAWGTSYFAKTGNNLFGQWCFTKGCGIVPRKRNEGATHEVAKFETVGESVATYIKNLNSHPAYKPLRTARYVARQQKRRPSGHELAIGLQKYSAKGMEYVEIIRVMIKKNKEYLF